MENEVINALLRLQRAGDKNRQATLKLRKAARELAMHVMTLLPEEIISATELDRYTYLPRGYYARGWHNLLSPDRSWELTIYHKLSPRLEDQPVAASRDTAFRFAEDVTTGWLDDLADWLEMRVTGNNACTNLLMFSQKKSRS
jgi:hypothetical protein